MFWFALVVSCVTGQVALAQVLHTVRFVVRETGDTKGLRDLAAVLREVWTKWIPRLRRRSGS